MLEALGHVKGQSTYLMGETQPNPTGARNLGKRYRGGTFQPVHTQGSEIILGHPLTSACLLSDSSLQDSLRKMSPKCLARCGGLCLQGMELEGVSGRLKKRWRESHSVSTLVAITGARAGLSDWGGQPLAHLPGEVMPHKHCHLQLKQK